MKELKLLFCFSNNIDTVIASLLDYSHDNDYIFQIDQITDYSNLVIDDKLNSYDCIILQQFFNMDDPITVDYLCNFNVLKKVNIICIFDELNRKDYGEQLYNKGLYNCFFGEDITNLSIAKFVDILANGRNLSDARTYYQINDNNKDGYRFDGNSIKKIIELVELYNDDEELLLDEFNNITSNFLFQSFHKK